MKNTLIALTFLAFTYTGCQHSTSNDSHADMTGEIVLDNGKKWVVVPEMMSIIQAMESDVKTFNGTNLEEHKTLADKLQDHLDKLTSNCTMTGQGHDELHKWLLPYLDMVAVYNHSETAKEAQETYTKIKDSFDSVSTNFE